jgi:acyl-CoA synthetase (AMP-forming)/AMP-acid ligase II
MDQQGCVRISGRVKDTIIRGGETIQPPDTEAVMARSCNHI